MTVRNIASICNMVSNFLLVCIAKTVLMVEEEDEDGCHLKHRLLTRGLDRKEPTVAGLSAQTVPSCHCVAAGT